MKLPFALLLFTLPLWANCGTEVGNGYSPDDDQDKLNKSTPAETGEKANPADHASDPLEETVPSKAPSVPESFDETSSDDTSENTATSDRGAVQQAPANAPANDSSVVEGSVVLGTLSDPGSVMTRVLFNTCASPFADTALGNSFKLLDPDQKTLVGTHMQNTWTLKYDGSLFRTVEQSTQASQVTIRTAQGQTVSADASCSAISRQTSPQDSEVTAIVSVTGDWGVAQLSWTVDTDPAQPLVKMGIILNDVSLELTRP